MPVVLALLLVVLALLLVVPAVVVGAPSAGGAWPGSCECGWL